MLEEEEKDYVDAHVRFPVPLHNYLVEKARENYISLNKLVILAMKRWAEEKGELDL